MTFPKCVQKSSVRSFWNVASFSTTSTSWASVCRSESLVTKIPLHKTGTDKHPWSESVNCCISLFQTSRFLQLRPPLLLSPATIWAFRSPFWLSVKFPLHCFTQAVHTSASCALASCLGISVVCPPPPPSSNFNECVRHSSHRMWQNGFSQPCSFVDFEMKLQLSVMLVGVFLPQGHNESFLQELPCQPMSTGKALHCRAEPKGSGALPTERPAAQFYWHRMEVQNHWPPWPENHTPAAPCPCSICNRPLQAHGGLVSHQHTNPDERHDRF